jgi:hypothetical protein
MFSIVCVGWIQPKDAMAQRGQWVTITDSMYVDDRISLQEARETLLQRSRTAAIASVVGMQVQSTQLMTEQESGDQYLESFKSLTSNDVRGKIIDEKKPTFKRGVSGQDLLLYITYEGKVVEEKESPDPAFALEITTNRSVYQLGEAVEITVEATKDAYITMFSILSGNQVSMIFPNAYMEDNFVEAHQQRVIPNKEEREILEFTTIETKELKAPYTEMLLCVATKEPVQFDQIMQQIEYQDAWVEMNRLLMRIPRDQRVEDYAQYSVVKQ